MASKAAASEGEWGQGPTEIPHVHPSDRGLSAGRQPCLPQGTHRRH